MTNENDLIRRGDALVVADAEAEYLLTLSKAQFEEQNQSWESNEWARRKVIEVREAIAALPADPVVKADSCQRVTRKTFPILGQSGAKIDLQLVEDHGSQAQANHGQSIARLAQRGGLSWCELYAVLHNQHWQKMDSNEAMLSCRALEARYLAAIDTQPDPRDALIARLIAAWEALPGGRMVATRDVERWLASDMASAINAARSFVAAAK